MGNISATPRNQLLGLMADYLGKANDFATENNPPVRMLSGLLGVPGLQRTLNELSYGGALGTGSGMTWKPKEDTIEAAGLLAPMVAKAPAAINKGAAAVGKAVEPAVNRLVTSTMERGGMPAQLLQDMAQGTQSPLTVWHGSPHKFDKFDASKIGTGEGAQAYGHGIYTAESPQVAQQYQRDISRSQYAAGQGGDTDKIAGKPIEQFYEALQRKADKLPPHLAGPEYEKLSFLEDLMQQPSFDDALKRIDNEEIIPWAQSLKSQYQPAGQLYKIDLPDEHIAKMLDWDKPLSEQHPDVLSAMGYHNQPRDFEAEAKAVYGTPEYSRLEKLMDTRVGSAAVPDVTGAEWYRSTDDLLRGTAADDAARSEYLRSIGIPGIRYLDGGSRGTGAGTSNFVVFPGNEGLLTILERNGKPVNQLSGLLGY